MVDKDVREQFGQPPLNGIWVTFHKGTYAKNGSVALSKSIGICRMPSVGEMTILGETHESVLRTILVSRREVHANKGAYLEGDDATSRRDSQYTCQRSEGV